MQEEALSQAGGARIISQDSEDIIIPIITSATAPAPAPSQEEGGGSGVGPLLLRQGDSTTDQVLNASGTTTKIKGMLGNVQYYLKPTSVTATNLAIQVRCGWVHARLCWCRALALRVRMGYA